MELVGDSHLLLSPVADLYIWEYEYVEHLRVALLRVVEGRALALFLQVSQIGAYARLRVDFISLMIGLILEHQELESLIVWAVICRVRHGLTANKIIKICIQIFV